MRHHIQCHLVCRSDFNPRTPCGVRPLCAAFVAGDREFQSTHPVWGATCGYIRVEVVRDISIHAPRVGCDEMAQVSSIPPGNFNPRTPCGVRLEPPLFFGGWIGFQSTHPVWGATEPPARVAEGEGFQSTHPVWGATGQEGGLALSTRFQSTHPVWGATRHPPLCSLFRTHFNPRTPCGVRPDCPAPPQGHTYFNPRTPCGVRLAGQGGDFRPLGISIHAPRVGCDSRCWARFSRSYRFQSTHPVWGATIRFHVPRQVT